MDPSRKRGTFIGYSEIAKAYHIHVLGKRYIKVNKDVTFDEKESFHSSRESHPVTKDEEDEAPTAKILVLDSPPAEVLRVEPNEIMDPFGLMDTVEPIEKPIDVPTIKKRLDFLN